ncbi:MAG TPA: hypothetical protein VGO00_13355 [Kofleriaceae bacterium]|nr:hypothetical protein [Kofleriaceae bacterium]
MMLAFVIAVLGAPATSFAEDTDQVAKQSFERGRQLAGEAKWAQAFDAFSSGYDASHRSVFLFNMAECARALDDAPRARGLYQQYLAASPSGDLADTARTRLAAMPAPPPTTATTTTSPPRPTTTTPPPSPTVATTRPATTTSPPPTVATRPIVIPPLPPPHATTTTTAVAPPHATTLGPPPTEIRATATTPPAIGATTPTTTTTAATKPAPTLTVAQLPPTSPAERPIGVIDDSHPSQPIYRRTSFWVGVGLAVAAGTVAIIAASTHDNNCSTPGCIDLRR